MVMQSEPELLFIQAALAAMPFLILAGKNLFDPLTWLIGIVLTVPAWALYLYSGLRYFWNQDGSGVGGEVILIGLWPFFISFVCVRLGRRRSLGGGD